jgi:hypothetical protein
VTLEYPDSYCCDNVSAATFLAEVSQEKGEKNNAVLQELIPGSLTWIFFLLDAK